MASNNLPQVDQELLTEVQHLMNALGEPEKHITQRPGFIAAMAEMQGVLQSALARLQAQIHAVTTDTIENKASVMAFNVAARTAIEEYGILREEAAKNTRTLRRRPLSEEEIAKNMAFFERVFGVFPSDVRDMRDAAMVSSLRTTADALSNAPFALPSEDVQAFTQALTVLEALRKSAVDESLDDVPLQDQLNEARAGATAALSAVQNVLRGFLRIEKSPLSVEEFVSRRNKPTLGLDATAAITPTVAPAEIP